MAKEREDRKKEKKEKKERKEKKLGEAEELEAREKKISKKRKSESKKPEKSKKKSKNSDSDVDERPRKKSKKSDSDEEEKPRKKSKKPDSDEEGKPQNKSKESKKKKHKRSEESDDEPQTQIVRSHDSNPVTVPIATNESDSDSEFDKEDIKHLLESYSKEELVNLIYKTTAEKGSRLVSAVLESADRDSTKRNIFVRGLGWDTTQENLKAAFEVYGEIEECSVVMDKDTGKAKGYGFVLFKTRKAAREALKNPEKRMYNRTVSCNLALAKPSGAGRSRELVESVKIDLTHTANQSEVALPGLDLAHGHAHGLDKGHQHQNMPVYAGQNMPFFGHSQPPGFNPMYGAMMGHQGALMGNQMVAGLPNYRMFGPGMMNQGPPNHMGMVGQYVGEGNGVGPGFDDERAWYLR